jgi:transmembrane sensor
MDRYVLFLMITVALYGCGDGDITVLKEGSYHVGAGYGRTFLLPDGTKVHLSPQTTISLDKGYGKDNREIHLSGEALFDVPKAPNWPLVVDTRLLRIEVLGTRFRVDAFWEKPGEEVDLLEGRIKAKKTYPSDTDNEPAVLDAGEMVMINRDIDLMEKEKLSPEEVDKLRAKW